MKIIHTLIIRNSLYSLIIDILKGNEIKTEKDIISRLSNEYYILYQIKIYDRR